jgi:hypothetical protein
MNLFEWKLQIFLHSSSRPPQAPPKEGLELRVAELVN